MSIPAVSVVDQVSTALSLASLKNQVIASNIANRDTQGYQRLQVRFDAAMARADVVAEPAEASADTPVSLEQDLVTLSSNSGRYEALARVLNRYFSLVSTITNSGRG
jgi:flagellar basal-body rod protein FlgB